MRRILWLPSDTSRAPVASTAMPPGFKNSAAVPTPLVEPDTAPVEPPPANVTTVRLG